MFSADAELLWRWRESVLAMMYTRVSVAGEDATGEEYADRAELQEKLDIYLEAFAVLLSDWRACLTGERSALCVSPSSFFTPIADPSFLR